MTSEPAAPKAPFSHREATPIALLGSPVSADAIALVDYLMDNVVLVGPNADKRPTTIAKSRQALGALLADLFDLIRSARPGRRLRPAAHGMSPKDFPASKLGFGRDIFARVKSSLEEAGLLSIETGQPQWRKAFGKVHNFKGQVTTFHATPELIDLAASLGVKVADWKAHWRSKDPKSVVPRSVAPRVELRGRKARFQGKKQVAAILPVDTQDPRVRELLAGVEKLNDFLAEQEISGIAFPGLRRIFSDGDQPDFAWNKGGRYFSLGGGHLYETRSADQRMDSITFNGEPVGEADIRASHLTLLHALMDRPFDPGNDPYTVDGVADRDLVKWWCTQAIGSSNPRPRQWASDKKEAYAARHGDRQLQQDHPIAEVGVAVRARHPLLDELATCGISTLDLQFHEAEILRLAMDELMAAAVTVLPIHDGLIVAVKHIPMAQQAVTSAFRGYVGGVIGHPPLVMPLVVPKWPQDLSLPYDLVGDHHHDQAYRQLPAGGGPPRVYQYEKSSGRPVASSVPNGASTDQQKSCGSADGAFSPLACRIGRPA